MADFTSAEIQAFKKMSHDEMIEYYNKTGINVMALDLKTIVASDLAEAIKDHVHGNDHEEPEDDEGGEEDGTVSGTACCCHCW